MARQGDTPSDRSIHKTDIADGLFPGVRMALRADGK